MMYQTVSQNSVYLDIFLTFCGNVLIVAAPTCPHLEPDTIGHLGLLLLW